MVIYLVFIAFMLNALMDLSSEDKLGNTIYWNKTKGSELKYKKPKKPYIKCWYHFGIKPNYKEKFPLSTTWFVFLTDGWHLLKFLFINCFMLIIFILSGYNLLLVAVCKIAQWIGFSTIYEKFSYTLRFTIIVIFSMIIFYLINEKII